MSNGRSPLDTRGTNMRELGPRRRGPAPSRAARPVAPTSSGHAPASLRPPTAAAMIRSSVSSSPASVARTSRRAARPRGRPCSTSSAHVGGVEEHRRRRARTARASAGRSRSWCPRRRRAWRRTSGADAAAREDAAEQHLLLVAARERSDVLPRARGGRSGAARSRRRRAAARAAAEITPSARRCRGCRARCCRGCSARGRAPRSRGPRGQRDPGGERLPRACAGGRSRPSIDDRPARPLGAEQREEQLGLTLALRGRRRRRSRRA